MIWNFIRDFFVQYIFGGLDSSLNYHWGFVGQFFYGLDGGGLAVAEQDTSNFLVPVGSTAYSDAEFIAPAYISIGDWLSTTATIIVMCLIIWLFLKITIYLFKAGAGLLKW